MIRRVLALPTRGPQSPFVVFRTALLLLGMPPSKVRGKISLK
jgi:hypothetical protein